MFDSWNWVRFLSMGTNLSDIYDSRTFTTKENAAQSLYETYMNEKPANRGKYSAITGLIT